MTARKTALWPKAVEVTQEAVEDGVACLVGQCPIAQALKTAIPTAHHIEVDIQCMKWTDRRTGKRYTFLTPPEGQTFIAHFDVGDKDVRPFTLRIPRTPIQIRDSGAKGGKKAVVVSNGEGHEPTIVGGHPIPRRVRPASPKGSPLRQRSVRTFGGVSTSRAARA